MQQPRGNYQQKKIYTFLKKYRIFTIIDGGAHKGEFINFIKKKLKDFEIVYTFEPQKNIFEILKINSNSSKIFCYNYALSDSNDYRKLKINNITSTSTFSEINEKSYWFIIKNLLLSGRFKSSFINEENVKTITLDSFVKKNNIKKIDLLKIDTEGHDLNVLKGSNEIFKQKKVKLILIEFHFSKMYKNYNIDEIHNYLSLFNFVLIKKFKFPFLLHEDRLYELKD